MLRHQRAVPSRAIKKVIANEEHKKRMADMTLKLKYMDAAQFSKYWDEYEATVVELMKLAKEQ
jgi:tripartite-type tricarboxylate transporter receptor subunit TctC